MTIALCYKCGSFKFGAFNRCEKCGALPESEDDVAVSFALTDQVCNKATLEQLGQHIAKGMPIHLDAEIKEALDPMMQNEMESLQRVIVPVRQLIQAVIRKNH